jgi:flagellar hook-associated protein 2
LVVNSSQLGDVLAGRVDDVSMSDVKNLFALAGQSDNTGIQFILGNSDTVESTDPYQVDITQAAERATVLAGSALAATTVINGANNTFSITIDGELSGTLTLNDGSYSRQEIADHLEELINSADDLMGRSVAVNLESDTLRITSEAYGSNSQVTIGSGTALGDLGFAGTETDDGLDVAGKFVVDGVDETATGTGRLLVGDASNEHTAGIQLKVTLTSSQLQAGTDANLTITRGIASQLDQEIDGLLDSVSGQIKVANDGFEDRIEYIDASIERLNELFAARQASLQKQFVALEMAMNQLQNSTSFALTQLASIASTNTNSSK